MTILYCVAATHYFLDSMRGCEKNWSNRWKIRVKPELLVHRSGNIRRGLVDRYLVRCLRSQKCGSPSRSMMIMDRPLCIENVHKLQRHWFADNGRVFLLCLYLLLFLNARAS